MYVESLLRSARSARVRALVIGAGEYGFSFVAQSRRAPGVAVVAIHARRPERGVAAFKHAGLPDEAIAVCDTAAQARAALDAGKAVVSSDAPMLIELPLDVVVESTGAPEAAALHADLALRHGKHVAMVSKEADSVVGPLFHRRAKGAGLVYTPVDGDQPSLLMQLVVWAQLCGLEILSAGKSSEYDFVWDPAARRVTSLDRVAAAPGFEALWSLGTRPAREVVQARAEMLAAIPQHTVPDLIEMLLVANATGLGPDVPAFHAPVARTTEVADILVPAELGGILGRAGVVDVFNGLLRPDEPSFAGGVFVVVRCHDRKSWEVLRAKGHVVSRSGEAAMIYRPSHLLGVESATTILAAALDRRSSGPEDVRPRYDVVGRTTKALPAGTLLTASGHHHQIEGVEGLMVEARRADGENPIPFYQMADNRLAQDVPAGTIITAKMVTPPAGSRLWSLRREMEEVFNLR
ncbi:MAG: NAD(P)H-dependent oxidoreductase [Candidatus Methylomirabilales bacterium]